MNLQQLRYVRAVADNGLSVSKAAAALHTSQPGVSQQIRLLERELGVDIFVRERQRIGGLTDYGKEVLERATRALAEIEYIQTYAQSVRREGENELVVITSRTQARYVLPAALERFSTLSPHVHVDVRHGTAVEIIAALSSGVQAIGITPGDVPHPDNVVVIPYARYPRRVIVPRGHALLGIRRPTLEQIARYPLITYDASTPGRHVVLEQFRQAGTEPEVVLSAIDADVIKACVERGLGVAVLPEIAFDRRRDQKLSALRPVDLFPEVVACIALQRSRALRAHELRFIQLLAPEWTERRLTAAMASTRNSTQDQR